MALRSELKAGLIAAGVGFVVGGIFFASVKQISKTESYGYSGVLLFSSLVAVPLGLITTGASLFVGRGEDHAIAHGRLPAPNQAHLDLPQPVDNLSKLGQTPDERVLSALSYDVATGRAKTQVLVDGMRELNIYRSGPVGQPPMAQQVPLPMPIAQAEPPAIPMPAQYEHPSVERMAPRPVQEHILYGEEQNEDLWGVVPDHEVGSMSAFGGGGSAEDIFA